MTAPAPDRKYPQAKEKQAPNERRSAASSLNAVAGFISRILSKPQTDYLVILTVTVLLVGLGLTMVLSSSMVTSRSSGGTVFTEFSRQSLIVLVGLVSMWFTMRISPRTIRRLSRLLVIVAFALLFAVLIPGIGVGAEEVGSNSWIRIGSVGIQPSEVAKLALAVWGSASIAKRLHQSKDMRVVLGPTLGLGAVMLLAVLLQKDLGMMMSVGIVLLALAFFAGVNARLFYAMLAAVGVIGLVATIEQAYRSARFTTWIETLLLNFKDGSTQGAAYQSHQGILSLSDGGLTGLGLGQSRAKWFYLPEATNDFIFAVVGEELGFLGAMAVVVLFALLGWFGIRTALAHTDPFMRTLAATLTLGVVVQAFFNMGYVVGLWPMTGVQLPLISAGGSSAVITLMSLGLLANCARHEPAAVSSMQHEGRPLVDRLLFLPEPQIVIAGTERRVERRNTTHRYGEPVTRQRGSAGRTSQDVRRDRDRLAESKRRNGTETMERGYDGRRRSALPQARNPRSNYGRSLHADRFHRPDSRRH